MLRLVVTICLCLLDHGQGETPLTVWNEAAVVGQSAGGRLALPVSQTLTPAGTVTELPKMRPNALALSPDGRWLVTSGKTSALVFFDLPKGLEPQALGLPGEGFIPDQPATHQLKPDKGDQISYTGLVFSPDGTRLYVSNVRGSIKVFSVTAEGIAPFGSWPLPAKASPERAQEIPAGLAVSPDGARLYVCGSLSNRLHELDTATGRVLRSLPVGMIPYHVVLHGESAWVINRAGPVPQKGDAVETAGKGVNVKVEGRLFLSVPGTVSALDLAGGTVRKEIPVGRQPGAAILSSDGAHLIVANADDDTLSIISVEKEAVVETPSVRWKVDDPFGASPTALAFGLDNKTLLVCLGTQNAVGVFDFEPGKTRIRGMIPTAWYPSDLVLDKARQTLHVANMKGLGSGVHLIRQGKSANSHEHLGAVTHVPFPNAEVLETFTEQTLANYRVDVVRNTLLPPRPDQAAVPVPERSGEPSVFKHVVYIIRENRTYDQVLGDMPEGKGDKSLCIFGENVTPNVHKLAREFVLLDNTYCSGVLSADGHNWSLSAFANDYLERSFAGFPRSYPDALNDGDHDVMAWSPQGFLWSAAAAKGRTVRVCGEMCIGGIRWNDKKRPGKPKFQDFLADHHKKTSVGAFDVKPGHASVAPHLALDYPAWAEQIPDQVRADIFIRHLEACERGEKQFENLHILSLPNDHTAGTKPGTPTPAATVADNDLALGRIVEALSRSKFWKETCLLTIEDDPQNGWDHVSGFRTVCLVASPYTRRGAVVSTHYNQPGVIRTMGLMLGFPPLNQMDAGSTPLRDCFMEKADLRPYEAVPAKTPIDQMNKAVSAIADPRERALAEASAKLPLDKVDACDEDELNRILWHAMKGMDAEYPSWATVPLAARGEDEDEDEDEK